MLQAYRGAELSPFSFYIAEVNLLLQITPVMQRMQELIPNLRESPFTTGVVQCDALELLPDMRGLSHQEKGGSRSEYDIIQRDRVKQRIYEEIRDADDFDYCCANPPYIREDDHKELFQSTLAKLPGWSPFYQGKMDYLYFFIILGLRKLRPGGWLCFVTTSYWLEASGARNLRQAIADLAELRLVVFFDGVQLFEHAPGQNNIVFVLRRKSTASSDHIPIKVVQTKKSYPGVNIERSLQKLCAHILDHLQESEFSDEYMSIHISPLRQSELGGDPWHMRASRSVSDALTQMELHPPLQAQFTVKQGLITGADVVTRQNIEKFPPGWVTEHRIRIGDPIFFVPAELVPKLRLNAYEMSHVHDLYKASGVGRYVPLGPACKVLYVGRSIDWDRCPNLLRHLERFRPLLSLKRETQAGRLPWYQQHWPRTSALFEGEKIVVSKWPAQNDFAFDDGPFYGEANIYYIKPSPDAKVHSWSPKALLAILNSSVMSGYFAGRVSKRKQKYFLPADRIEALPIPDARGFEAMDTALTALVDDILSSLEAIASLGKFSWSDAAPQIATADLAREWPDSLPLGEHPDVVIGLPTSSRAEKLVTLQITRNGARLKFSPSGFMSITVEDSALLEVLSSIVPEHTGTPWAEAKHAIRLPLDVTKFRAELDRRRAQVKELVDQVRAKQAEIDEIVPRLYGLAPNEAKILSLSGS